MDKEQNTLEINDLDISNRDILQITILNEVFKNLEYCNLEGVYRANVNLSLSLNQVKQLDSILNELINK